MAHYLGLIILLASIFLNSGCASYTRSMIWENKIKPHGIEKTSLSRPAEARLNHELEYLWLGHATVLIKLGNHWLITDPVLHKRIGPPELFNNAFGIKRRKALPITIEELPDLSAVLISHAHYDHLDLPSLRSIYSQGKPTLIVPRKVSELTTDINTPTIELDWLENSQHSTQLEDIKISVFRVEHYGYIPWGKRKQWTGFNGYLIEYKDKQILFFGDTSYHRYRNEYGQPLKYPQRVDWRDKFSSLQLKKGFDLCIIPIGDSHFRQNHSTPEEAAHLALYLGCNKMLPIHYDTFVLSPPEPEGEDARSRLIRYLETRDKITLIKCGNNDEYYPEIGRQCRLVD